jgi:glycosyltransferase involved in cell wall biosynthesis
LAAKCFYLILAEASYAKIYEGMTSGYVVVQNMPDNERLSEFRDNQRTDHSENGIFYIGAVTEIRGIDEIMQALDMLQKQKIDFTFKCVGPVDDKFMEELRKKPYFRSIEDRVHFYGRMSIVDAYKLSKDCKIGVSILYPTENYLESYSTKVFEYMSVGLIPVVSDFRIYDFLREHKAGILVDPKSAESISEAFSSILTGNHNSRDLASNSISIAIEKFSWSNEKKKMLDYYHSILNNS